MLWVLNEAAGEHTFQATYTAYTYDELYATIYGTVPAVSAPPASAVPPAPEQHI
jgi:hypothetical protein